MSTLPSAYRRGKHKQPVGKALNRHHPIMDKVKIKRVKRNKKKIGTKEKVLAGLGLGSSLLGGASSVSPKPQSTQFVRSQTAEKSTGLSKIRRALAGIFGAKTVQAADLDALAQAVTDARDALQRFDDWYSQAMADVDKFAPEDQDQRRADIEQTRSEERPDLVTAVAEAEKNYSEAADEILKQQQAPKEGDAKIEDGFSYTYHSGSWQLDNGQAKTESGFTYTVINHLWKLDDGQHKTEDGHNWHSANGGWVDDGPVTTEPAEGATKTESGFSYTYHSGSWQLDNGQAKTESGFTYTVINHLWKLDDGQTKTENGHVYQVVNHEWKDQGLGAALPPAPFINFEGLKYDVGKISRQKTAAAVDEAAGEADGQIDVWAGMQENAVGNWENSEAVTSILAAHPELKDEATNVTGGLRRSIKHEVDVAHLTVADYAKRAKDALTTNAPKAGEKGTINGRSATYKMLDGVLTLVEDAGHSVQNPDTFFYTSDGNNDWTLNDGQTKTEGGHDWLVVNHVWQDRGPTSDPNAPKAGDSGTLNGRSATYKMVGGVLTLVEDAGHRVKNPDGMWYLSDGNNNWTLDINQDAPAVETHAPGYTDPVAHPGQHWVVTNGSPIGEGGWVDDVVTETHSEGDFNADRTMQWHISAVTKEGRWVPIAVGAKNPDDPSQTWDGSQWVKASPTISIKMEDLPDSFTLNDPLARIVGLSTTGPTLAQGDVPAEVIVIGDSYYVWQDGSYVRQARGDQAASLITAPSGTSINWYQQYPNGPGVGGIAVGAAKGMGVVAGVIGATAVAAGIHAASMAGVITVSQAMGATIASLSGIVPFGIGAAVGGVVVGIQAILNRGQDKVRDTHRIEDAQVYMNQIVQQYWSITPTSAEEAQALHDAATQAILQIFNSVQFEKASSKTSQWQYLRQYYLNPLDDSLHQYQNAFQDSLQNLDIYQSPDGVRVASVGDWGQIRVDRSGNLLSVEHATGVPPPPSVLRAIRDGAKVTNLGGPKSGLPPAVGPTDLEVWGYSGGVTMAAYGQTAVYRLDNNFYDENGNDVTSQIPEDIKYQLINTRLMNRDNLAGDDTLPAAIQAIVNASKPPATGDTVAIDLSRVTTLPGFNGSREATVPGFGRIAVMPDGRIFDSRGQDITSQIANLDQVVATFADPSLYVNKLPGVIAIAGERDVPGLGRVAILGNATDGYKIFDSAGNEIANLTDAQLADIANAFSQPAPPPAVPPAAPVATENVSIPSPAGTGTLNYTVGKDANGNIIITVGGQQVVTATDGIKDKAGLNAFWQSHFNGQGNQTFGAAVLDAVIRFSSFDPAHSLNLNSANTREVYRDPYGNSAAFISELNGEVYRSADGRLFFRYAQGAKDAAGKDLSGTYFELTDTSPVQLSKNSRDQLSALLATAASGATAAGQVVVNPPHGAQLKAGESLINYNLLEELGLKRGATPLTSGNLTTGAYGDYTALSQALLRNPQAFRVDTTTSASGQTTFTFFATLPDGKTISRTFFSADEVVQFAQRSWGTTDGDYDSLSVNDKAMFAAVMAGRDTNRILASAAWSSLSAYHPLPTTPSNLMVAGTDLRLLIPWQYGFNSSYLSTLQEAQKWQAMFPGSEIITMENVLPTGGLKLDNNNPQRREYGLRLPDGTGFLVGFLRDSVVDTPSGPVINGAALGLPASLVDQIQKQMNAPNMRFGNVNGGAALGAGDAWQIVITNSQPNAPVYAVGGKDGASARVQIGTTDANGNFVLQQSLVAADAGSYKVDILVGNARIGQSLQFTVGDKPTQPVVYTPLNAPYVSPTDNLQPGSPLGQNFNPSNPAALAQAATVAATLSGLTKQGNNLLVSGFSFHPNAATNIVQFKNNSTGATVNGIVLGFSGGQLLVAVPSLPPGNYSVRVINSANPTLVSNALSYAVAAADASVSLSRGTGSPAAAAGVGVGPAAAAVAAKPGGGQTGGQAQTVDREEVDVSAEEDAAATDAEEATDVEAESAEVGSGQDQNQAGQPPQNSQGGQQTPTGLNAQAQNYWNQFNQNTGGQQSSGQAGLTAQQLQNSQSQAYWNQLNQNAGGQQTAAGGQQQSGLSASDQTAINNLRQQISDLQARIDRLNSSPAGSTGVAQSDVAGLQAQINRLQDLVNRLQPTSPVRAFDVGDTQTARGLQMPQGLQMPPGYLASTDYVGSAVAGAEMPANATYTVKKGDTLWKIAKKFYGDGRQWRKILDANPGCLSRPGNTKTLKVGFNLVIPE